MQAIVTAAPSITAWNPQVEYFEHQRDGSLLARLYFTQPPGSKYNFTTGQFEEEINANLDSSSEMGNFTFGGTAVKCILALV